MAPAKKTTTPKMSYVDMVTQACSTMPGKFCSRTMIKSYLTANFGIVETASTKNYLKKALTKFEKKGDSYRAMKKSGVNKAKLAEKKAAAKAKLAAKKAKVAAKKAAAKQKAAAKKAAIAAKKTAKKEKAAAKKAATAAKKKVM